jgi:hypothetical protein
VVPSGAVQGLPPVTGWQLACMQVGLQGQGPTPLAGAQHPELEVRACVRLCFLCWAGIWKKVFPVLGWTFVVVVDISAVCFACEHCR